MTEAPTETELAGLTPDQRHMLALVADGQSYEDIAAHLNLPIGTVKSRISRARQALRKLRESEAVAARAGLQKMIGGNS